MGSYVISIKLTDTNPNPLTNTYNLPIKVVSDQATTATASSTGYLSSSSQKPNVSIKNAAQIQVVKIVLNLRVLQVQTNGQL